MKQIKQTFSLQSKGGFSCVSLRFGVLGFLTLVIVLAPFLGMLASFAVVMVFATFTGVKIREFQEHNPKSFWLHEQAMDKMYHYGVNAERIAKRLEFIDQRNEIKMAERKRVAKLNDIKNSKHLTPRLSLRCSNFHFYKVTNI